MAGLNRLSHVVFCAIVLVILEILFPRDYMQTSEFAERNLLYKAGFLVGVSQVKLIMLCLGFTAMESYFIACGQGYRPARVNDKGIKEDENFNAIRSIDIVPILTLQSWQSAVNAWNI